MCISLALYQACSRVSARSCLAYAHEFGSVWVCVFLCVSVCVVVCVWFCVCGALESVLGRFSPATSHLERPDATDRRAVWPVTFKANLALVLLISMLEFGSVSCYGCSFVWIFCIRLAMFFFCVTYLFFPDVKIWQKKKS